MTKSQDSPLLDCSGDSTPRDRQNLKVFLSWALSWAVSFLGATWLQKQGQLTSGPTGWMIAAVPTLVGLVVCFSYAHYLRQADDLQRSIHLRAISVGFAAGWIALSSYPMFERLGAPAADPGTYVTVMAVAFSLALIQGSRSYR